MTLAGSTIQGSVLNGQLSATVTDSYNVAPITGPDTSTRVTVSYQFAAAKP
jgi:hypothetical protein